MTDLFDTGTSAYPLERLAEPGPAYARCRRQLDGRYAPKIYRGSQRPPVRPDECGALCVLDLMGGGRFVLYAISGDREWVRVEALP